MFFASRRRCHRPFAVMVFAWGLIGMTLSTTDFDASTFFSDDSTAFFTAVDSNTIETGDLVGGWSSNSFSWSLLSPSSSLSELNVPSQADDLESSTFGYGMDPSSEILDDDSQWLTADTSTEFVSTAAPLDEVSSSCIGEDDDSSTSSTLSSYWGRKNKKMRRENDRPMCLENNEIPASSSGLNLPDLTHSEQPGSESKTKPKVGVETWNQNEYRCPPQQSEHVCCSGPVIEEYPFLGLYEQVQNCEPCMLLICCHSLSHLS